MPPTNKAESLTEMLEGSVVQNTLSLPGRLRRAAAVVSVVLLSSLTYAYAPYNHEQMAKLYGWQALSFTGAEFLFWSSVVYSLGLTIYHLWVPYQGLTKSQRFFLVLNAFARTPLTTWRRGLSKDDRVAVLATALKAFFGPLMVMSLMIFCVGAISHGLALLAASDAYLGVLDLFNDHGYWIAIRTILFVDVLVFTVGYLVESPRLGNEIRSVDPTLLGWAAAMACYPPFNFVTSKLLGAPVSDFPQFDNPSIHLALNILLLGLMAIYAWASVALGLKASNLTHRGIVARGPYAVIRHPAYVCKNLAWWIGAVPLVALEFKSSAFQGISAVGSVAAWSLLYVLRALTEEDHLRRVDGEYARYAAVVRHRFIPGVY